MLSGVTCLELNNSPENGFPEFDIIFIHGLLSDALAAWTTKNGDIWPTWIRQTVQNSRIALLNYPAPSFYGSKESAVSIKERGRNLADFLPTIGVGRRPTVFICHSLGGIILKEILRNCIETGCSVEIAANTIGIVYLGTPHSGADLAKLASAIGSKITADLRPASPYLIDLKHWFSDYANDRKLFVSAYAETQLLYGQLIVSRESSDPNVGGCVCIPIDGNHSTICKPSSLSSDIFLRIQRDINTAIGRYEKMTSMHPVALSEILALPSLTNNMYFDVLDFLNRELSKGSERGIIISNPCGGSKPSCIIVSEYESVVSRVRPLQDRWPDRFRVEMGLLGEFTEEDEENSEEYEIPLREKMISESVENNVRSLLAVAIADYISDQVTLEINVSTFWRDESDIYFVSALHALESAIRRAIERVLNSGKPDGDERRKTYKRLYSAFSSIERLQNIDKSETISESIMCLYRKNNFSFRVKTYMSSTRNKRLKKANSVHIRAGRIHSVSYEKDTFVFCTKIRESERSSIHKWVSANKQLAWNSSDGKADPIDVGVKLTAAGDDRSELIVESVNQTVFFPLNDRVTSLHSVIVLSGANIEKGSSGSAIFNRNGRPYAMLIGRTFKDGECKALAVELKDVASNVRPITGFIIHQSSEEIVYRSNSDKGNK